jgi:hypothetical protein
MTSNRQLFVATVAGLFLAAGSIMPVRGENPTPGDVIPFGALKALSAQDARSQALQWLTGTGKADAAALKEFDSIWSDESRTVLDRLVQSFCLGEPEAAALLEGSRDKAEPAPTIVPGILRDGGKPLFFRANLGLAYARNLSHRRIYEEALDALRLFRPEQVIDPSTYLFHRAVAEHAMLLKEDATRTIVRLLDDTVDVPDRHKMVAVLMAFEMGGWQEKDLGSIARKMDNIERRLELARGGPKTQKLQKDVVARLDEIIKQIENQSKGNCNGGACPNGGKPSNGGSNNPTSPQLDSFGGNNGGPGNADPKKLEQIAKDWGKLPEKQRAEALQSLTREMPPKYREIIETYFKKLAAGESSKP